MLENLFNLIKDDATDSVINNPAIPNEQNNAVLADATHSVAEGFQGVLAGGGLENILSLFGKNTNGQASAGGLLNNPIVSNIISNFTNKLTTNHNVPADQAGGIANNLIPSVISNLVNKTNDSGNTSFDINSIIGSLTGNAGQSDGKGFDFQGLLNNFSNGGLDVNGDGKVGFDDIISKVTGGAQQQQQQVQTNGGGGFMDMIQGFLK